MNNNLKKKKLIRRSTSKGELNEGYHANNGTTVVPLASKEKKVLTLSDVIKADSELGDSTPTLTPGDYYHSPAPHSPSFVDENVNLSDSEDESGWVEGRYRSDSKFETVATYHDVAKSREALSELEKEALQKEHQLQQREYFQSEEDVEDKPTHIHFSISYYTQYGQQLRVVGSLPELGEWDAAKAQPMLWNQGGNWAFELITKKLEPFDYKYLVTDDKGNVVRWEGGLNRKFRFAVNEGVFELRDLWQP